MKFTFDDMNSDEFEQLAMAASSSEALKVLIDELNLEPSSSNFNSVVATGEARLVPIHNKTFHSTNHLLSQGTLRFVWEKPDNDVPPIGADW